MDRIHSNKKQHGLFDTLRELDPNLEEHLRDGEHTSDIAALIDAGRDGACSTDAQSLKKAILDWVHPDGGALIPPLPRDSRVGHRFAHVDTGRLLCPTHLDWDDAKIHKKLQNRTAVVTADQCPTFLYGDLTYDDDDPWEGLFRGQILVQTFKYIFTSPSSASKEGAQPTKPANALLHNMQSVTLASLVYVATQVRVALSSAAFFSKSHAEIKHFYDTMLNQPCDPAEEDEINELLTW
ncbi:uncharacterized protein B0H18DRAFT_870190 [Fomitopsis serialis]|uniref:uncharacterized protein n=1 Tax=Fomitopsis serialis TaxID=139415 RepID=UPI002008A8E5|nr:uncharacterized protein B0H18DRAFT_870190 [Neoantrodia serialis]KAH9933863.1 hypothetical protein B0H18DRAFT_870190 [Neoantrodia serialis]